MPKLNCKVDWFSFTFPVRATEDWQGELNVSGVIEAFDAFVGINGIQSALQGEWRHADVGGFYQNRIVHQGTGATIDYSLSNKWALFSLGGQACDAVLSRINLATLASAAGGRATRIDFAVDIECDIMPSDFVARRQGSRIVSGGNYNSPTGETCYVGSRSSDRMARAYRYYEPHPRAKYLRVEAEYKGDAAKAACEMMEAGNLTIITLSAHLPFGWAHPIWDTGQATVSKIKARAYDKEGAGTLKWLDEVVAPALASADINELISLPAWLVSNFVDIYKRVHEFVQNPPVDSEEDY